MDELLLIPGPTQVPPPVREAVARQMINHRGPAFAALYREVQEGLRPLFGTEEELLLFPASGTGVMESAVVNLFSPGERVLAAVMGEFGERFAAIAEAYGLAVDRLRVPAGEAVTAEALAEHLDRAGADRYRGVLVTHNETSTGVLLDLPAVARAVKERGLLLAVDAVSSAGGVPLRCDAWGVDVLVTASQKALMTPPGLGVVYVSRAAWEAVERARLPRFYWDYRRARQAAGKAQTPYTPAVGLWFGLRAALALVHAEGLEGVYARHRRLAAAFRAGARALGLGLLAGEDVASPLVTALTPPAGCEAGEVVRRLREEEGVVVAGGQGPLKGRILRVAHMGATTPEQVVQALAALGRVLGRLGAASDPAAGAEAARRLLAGAAVAGR